MMENALYKLEKVTDNPKFEGFGFVRQESLRGDPKSGIGSLTRDFGTDDLKTKGRAWTVPPLAPFWSPQPVVGRVAAFNDYPCVNMLIPVFSRRAVDALRDFLEPNGELLPLVSNIGEYYAYNITTVADILDHSKSQIIWKGEKSVTAFEITRYECFADKMTGFSIFHLVELPSSTMVSQVFVDQVQEHDLQGFHFIKLWPWPEDVSWEEEERKHRKKKTQVKTKRGSKAIKGNTVVLILPTSKAKPTNAEKDRLAKIMDEIDAVLHDPAAKKNSPYFGNLEGDDVVDGEMRLLLSCPDADVLIDKLRPWLKTIPWTGGVKVLKRYGEYVDANCPEKYVEWGG